jgi:hypothetical protein
MTFNLVIINKESIETMKTKLFLLCCIFIFATSCKTSKPLQNTQYNKADDSFFPIYGITLGKTTIKEIAHLGYKCKRFELDGEDMRSGYCDAETLTFWDHDDDRIVESIYITNYSKMPDKWIQNFGFNWRLSYNEWIKLFKKLGFTIDTTKPPVTEVYSERNTLSADFIATSQKYNLSFDLDFDYGNDDDDGYTVNSPFSLYKITVDCMK